MNDVQNIGLTHLDENHDFVKLYNATSTNETLNDHLNESIYPNNDNFCKYYTPDELIKTIGLENKQLSMFCINCRSINANWEALNELIYNMSNERFHFDIIGLTEIFKLNEGFNYTIAGYHDILSNTRHDSDDGHGGVGIYINENMSFFKRDDLTIFIPHVIESLFVEVKIN